MKFRDRLTVLRSSTADAYGNPASDWTAPATHTEVAFILPGSARRKDWAAYCPPTTDIRAGDRLLWNGGTYDVVGEPELIRSPTADKFLVVSMQRLPDV